MGYSLKNILIVFGGSGLGGVIRYGMQALIYKASPFPLGTFVVNIAGCFLIGIFYGLSEKNNIISQDWRLALTTGLCGGFTTFSAFGYENMNLIKTGNYLYAGLYIAASILLGIASVFGGVFITRYL